MKKQYTKSLTWAATALLSLALSQTVLAQRVSLSDIEDRLSNIENAMYVPFKTQITAGRCNSAAIGSANPQIIIDGNADDGTFLVSSVLVKTNGVPASGFQFLALNGVIIDDTVFDTNTANLTGHIGTSIRESFDVLGKPVSVNSSNTDQTGGGNVPHQIIANSEGSNDIIFRFFCRSDTSNFDIANVLVSGWKRVDETISVTYTPGN
ncbi:MAG: hypothetical protein AB8G17_21735 [Gammaproteobacteria bacterium]